LVLQQVVLHRFLVNGGINEATLDVAMAEQFPHGCERNARFDKQGGPAVAELMDRRCDPGSSTVLLPGVMGDAVVDVIDRFIFPGS